MIGFVKGFLREKDFDNVVVECGGIGYNIAVTNSCLTSLPDIGEEVMIYTYLHVREDEISLYGFVSMEEKKLFLQLISVSGVGSKTALQILSTEKMNNIVNSIINEDIKVIANCKGIGKKTAERIIVELKDKIKPFDYIEAVEKAFIAQENNDYLEDAVVVLTSLGINKTQATKLVREVMEQGDTAEDLVSKVLKNMN